MSENFETEGSIGHRARFDIIRYAQGWEDTDILLRALQITPGDTCLAICAAGDNAISMLLGDPAKIIAVDLSPAQLACLRLRVALYQTLNHNEFLRLFGSVPGADRLPLLDTCLKRVPETDQVFWEKYREPIMHYGIGGVGKFERYFRIFRTYILPLVHSKGTITALLEKKTPEQRKRFFDEKWNSPGWRLLLRGFFSRTVMGWLGRDPSFFNHVSGSVADHVMERVKHAFTRLDPSDNPYLAWILTGRHGTALPVALRAENYSIIRSRIDRITPMQLDIEKLPELKIRFNAYNLSDIFEYMDAAYFEKIYGILLDCAAPGARLAYWNMMVPRRAPEKYKSRILSDAGINQTLHEEDKTFFYSRFVAEQMKGETA